MKLHSFSELSAEQKKSMYRFIESFKYQNNYESYEEMTRFYEGIVFDYGKSHFSLWEDNQPIATLGVISKDAAVRGEIFILSINIKEQNVDCLEILLSRAFDYCSDIKDARFMFGIMHDRYYLIPAVLKSGFKESYKNLVMRYHGSVAEQDEEADKHFKTICPENIKDYQSVENAAFLQAPNGGMIEDEELQDLLEEYCGANMAGVFYEDNEPAGTYTLKIMDNNGWIDSIGVAPGFQRRGIGKKLLFRSIRVLQAAGAEKIELSVFNINTRAVNLYFKSGFQVESEHSIWYEK
jgi:ribosomal protein S18 acetylase RimI-like enzyme